MSQQGNPNPQPTPNRNLDPRSEEAVRAVREKLIALGSETRAERRAKQIVPLISTIAIHAAIVVLGFLVTWSVVMIQQSDDPVRVVADFHTMSYEPVVELKQEQNTSVERENPRQEDLSFLEFDHPLPDPFQMNSLEPMATAPNPVSPSAADFSTQRVDGTASFMGISASNAQRVVYVIDASGSMIAYLQFILHELSKSLESLTDQQSFGIVFFQRNQAVAVPPARRLTTAGRDATMRSLKWIDENVIPAGRSNPVPALEHALRLEPDAVFILSVNITGAGHYEIDQSDLLATLDRLNPVNRSTGMRRTQINCIQFLDPDPLDTLRLIADQHGGPGGYKFLSRQELGLTAR